MLEETGPLWRSKGSLAPPPQMSDDTLLGKVKEVPACVCWLSDAEVVQPTANETVDRSDNFIRW